MIPSHYYSNRDTLLLNAFLASVLCFRSTQPPFISRLMNKSAEISSRRREKNAREELERTRLWLKEKFHRVYDGMTMATVITRPTIGRNIPFKNSIV